MRLLRNVPNLLSEEEYLFPPPGTASQEGIVCAGGNLSPGVLLSAYRQGLFPWFGEGDPLLWWSPDPRFAILPATFHVPSSARRLLNEGRFKITVDREFPRVIRLCAGIERRGRPGTWITDSMIAAYERLHAEGFAHSVEAWSGEELAGGLYGVSLGSAFFGESMFSLTSGASRAAFLTFASWLFGSGFTLIDSQVHTDYVAGMGGVDLPRAKYLDLLKASLRPETRKGSWESPIDNVKSRHRIFSAFPLQWETGQSGR